MPTNPLHVTITVSSCAILWNLNTQVHLEYARVYLGRRTKESFMSPYLRAKNPAKLCMVEKGLDELEMRRRSPRSFPQLCGGIPCCCSVTKVCPMLCNPMDCSMPGFPVLHHLPDFAQTHVHRVGDAIHPSHPLSSLSPPAFNLSQHQGLF